MLASYRTDPVEAGDRRMGLLCSSVGFFRPPGVSSSRGRLPRSRSSSPAGEALSDIEASEAEAEEEASSGAVGIRSNRFLGFASPANPADSFGVGWKASAGRDHATQRKTSNTGSRRGCVAAALEAP